MDGVVVDEGVGGAVDEVEGLARLGLELAEELLVGPGRDGRGEQQRGEGKEGKTVQHSAWQPDSFRT